MYAIENGKKIRLVATFYHLTIAREIIQTSDTSYDLALYKDGKKIYSIVAEELQAYNLAYQIKRGVVIK